MHTSLIILDLIIYKKIHFLCSSLSDIKYIWKSSLWTFPRLCWTGPAHTWISMCSAYDTQTANFSIRKKCNKFSIKYASSVNTLCVSGRAQQDLKNKHHIGNNNEYLCFMESFYIHFPSALLDLKILKFGIM